MFCACNLGDSILVMGDAININQVLVTRGLLSGSYAAMVSALAVVRNSPCLASSNPMFNQLSIHQRAPDVTAGAGILSVFRDLIFDMSLSRSYTR